LDVDYPSWDNTFFFLLTNYSPPWHSFLPNGYHRAPCGTPSPAIIEAYELLAKRIRTKAVPSFTLAYLHFPRAFARACICVGTLTTNWKSPPMPKSSVAPEIHKSLDVHIDIAPEVSLRFVRVIDHLANLGHIHFRELIRIHTRVQTDLANYLLRRSPSNTVNIGQRYFHSLVSWKVNSCNTRHDFPPGEKTACPSEFTLDVACVWGFHK